MFKKFGLLNYTNAHFTNFYPFSWIHFFSFRVPEYSANLFRYFLMFLFVQGCGETFATDLIHQ